MKKILLFITILCTVITFAQVPQGISYQAIALNSSGNPVVSAPVGVRLSVVDNSATGTVLYTETHVKTTNAQGLFNLVIGQGTLVTGVFSAINWGTNSKFLKVEMDATGGTTYVLVGTTQLLSVPYAMSAGNISGPSANDSIENNKYSNFAFYDSAVDKVYAFNQNTGTWISVNGYAGNTLVGSNGNAAFYDSVANKVYAFNKTTGAWVSANGYAGNTLISSNGNFAFYDSAANKIFAFSSVTGTWISVNGYAGDTLVGSNANFAFYDNAADKVYAFNQNTGTWVFVSGYAGTTLIEANGNFAFYDSAMEKVYAFSKATGAWISANGYAGNTLIALPSN